MPLLQCKAQLSALGFWAILRLPQSVSSKLPSRGMVLVEGTMNDIPFTAVLDPDGKGSHWFAVDKSLLKATKAHTRDSVSITLEPSDLWPEPTVPHDLQKALTADPHPHEVWNDITPMARWDWIRWIGSTKQLETRNKRIEVACDFLNDTETLFPGTDLKLGYKTV